MSVSQHQLAAFQDAIIRLAQAVGPQAPAGPGQVLPALPSFGVNLFTNQGPTDDANHLGSPATIQSDDNHICIRGDHNAVIIYAIASPDAISPGSAPLATIQIKDSPSARGVTYTNVVDPQGTLTAIVATTKVQVSSVQPYIKATIAVTHGLWTVIACPVPATSSSTVNIPGPVNLTQVGGAAIALGQAVMASSLPVAIASNQTLPLPTGAATEATLAAESAKLPATLGQTTMAASLSVAIASNQSAVPISAASLPLPTGAATEATLAAESAKLPAALGQTTMAASLAVAIASNQSAVPISAASLPLPTGAATDASLLATQGTTPYHLVSLASTNANSVKGSAGKVYNAIAFNLNAAARYLKLFDKVAAPTPGVDTPVQTFLIPPNSSGMSVAFDGGLTFALGIGFCLTTGIADLDSGAVAAAEIVIDLAYK